MACQDLHGSTRRWYRVWKMEEFLSKLEKMETKTGYIDPRFAVRANASIDLQLRETTELKRKSKTTTSESAMAKQHKRKEGSRQHTLTLVCGGRLPPVTREQILRIQPVTKERIPPSQPVIRSHTTDSSISSRSQRTDSAFHPVTREWILRVSTNHPINTDRIRGVLARHIGSPENTYCRSCQSSGQQSPHF